MKMHKLSLFKFFWVFFVIFKGCFALFSLHKTSRPKFLLLTKLTFRKSVWVLSIRWVHVYTMTLCLYHESVSIPWVHVYTISPCLYHEFQKYRNTNYRNTEIQITDIDKYKLQKYRNTNERCTETKMDWLYPLADKASPLVLIFSLNQTLVFLISLFIIVFAYSKRETNTIMMSIN